MGRKAGALLWNRIRLLIPAGHAIPTTGFQVDTGLIQPNHSFPDYSPGEPPLGVVTAPPGPANSTGPASRVQVIPMAPVGAWTTITHGEPYVDPTTRHVFVQFFNADNNNGYSVNVLFWDPHAIVGPGDADTYHAPPPANESP